MKKSVLSIVVPVWNEAENITPLVERIHATLVAKNIFYEIIFVDDHSQDATVRNIKKLIKHYPIRLLMKKGGQGKAQSIYEGFEQAEGDVLLMLDGDLQYPPEAIPSMLEKIQKGADIIVANRVKTNTSRLRRVLSQGFRKFFGQILFGLQTDVQAGMKMFRRDVYTFLQYHPTSGWTFDLEFLHKATQSGFKVENVDIIFEKRAHGKSKVSFLKTSFEIGMNALSLKTRRPEPIQFPPHHIQSMLGAGVGFKRKKYITHSTLHHSKSAIQTFLRNQIIGFFVFLVLIAVCLVSRPLFTVQALIGILSFIYFLDVIFNLFLVLKSLQLPQEIIATDEELAGLTDDMLPVYSILCPLYKEAHVIEQFVNAISKLDYPKAKLDVMLLLEEDDKATIQAAEAMHLPAFVRIVVVPDSQPKTKPKACNYGLSQAKGEYLVIYDAEDVPDPLQLRKAYIGFQKVGRDVLCLQAKLNYYNPHQNLLTRFFTAEYSLWFDVTLTGLQAANTSIPLGGTSNHFRVADLKFLEGWDPFNVTEDADLGIRLFKQGYKTAIIDSVTLEEANSNVFNWIRQRSRWIKGYMQTYLVHTRKKFGYHTSIWHTILFHLSIGGKIAFILINPILWLLTILYFTAYRFVGPTIESMYPSYVFYMAAFSLVVGNFLFLYYYMIGCAKREQWSLIKYVYFVPLYWLMISWAGMIAFYQLLFKPHYWEKTIHGLHLSKKQKTIISFSIQTSFFPGNLPRQAFATFRRFLTEEKIRSGSMYVIANAIASFFTLLYSVYLGRVLSFEDFSLVSLINGLIAIVAILFGALGTTMNYKTSYLVGKDGEEAAVAFWAGVRKNTFFVAYALTGVWLASSLLLKNFFNLPNTLPILFFIPILLFDLAASADKSVLFSKLNFKVLSLLTILEPLLRVVIAIVFIKGKLDDLTYISIPAAAFIAFFVGWLFVRKYKKDISPSIKPAKFPFKFFLVSLMSGLSVIIFLNLDIILAKHYLPAPQAGLYALITTIGKMFFFLSSLASPFTIPLVSRNEGANRDSKRFLDITVWSVLFVSVIPFILFLFAGPYIVPVVFGERAVATLPYLPIVITSLICFSISRIYSDYYLAKKYYVFNAVPFLLGALTLGALMFVHSSVWSFVMVMSSAWSINLIVTLLLHRYHPEVNVFERNILDFFGAFLQSKPIPQLADGKLRILIFNWRDTKHKWAGGAEVYIQELAKRWVKDGNTVTIFCGTDNLRAGNEEIDGVKIIRRGGFYTVYVWAFFYYIFQLRKHYDVIVDSENGIPFFTPLYSRKPIFLLIHHVHQEVFRKSLRKPFAQLATFLEGKAMPFVYKNVQVITVSPSSKQEIIQHKLTEKEPIIIYNGVDLQTFKPSQKQKNPLVLYVGRLQYYKSLNIYIRTAKKILEQFPQVEFVIAGDGEQRMKLQMYARKLGLENNISFLGKISHEEKIALYQKAWIFVNPSFMEGWGITTIEANACGTPAVASNVPGLRDSINNPETGFLIEYGNVDMFAEKITQLITNKTLLKHMQDESVKWSSNFSWDESATKFLVLLQNAATQSAPQLHPEYAQVHI